MRSGSGQNGAAHLGRVNDVRLRFKGMTTAPMFRSHVPGIVWPAVPGGLALPISTLLFQFARSERWPAAKLRAWQLKQLGALLDHAARMVPHYATVLAAAGYHAGQLLDEQTWRRIPLLGRRELVERGQALVSPETPAGHGDRTPFHSSGATGTPVQGVSTALVQLMWEAVTVRDYLWQGRDLGKTLGVIRVLVEKKPWRSARSAAWSAGAGAIFHTGPALYYDGTRPVDEHLDWLLRHEPDYLLVFPSVLQALLLESERRGVKPERLRAVSTFAEQLDPALRGALARQWGVPLADIYSATETGYIALQCPEHPHYHVQAETVFVEVLNSEGRECAPGEVGRVVVTPLHNFAMPLIRYEIGDFAAPGSACACGRGLPVLERIAGRVRNMCVMPSGRCKWPALYGVIFELGLPIRQFRIVQHSLEQVEAMLVTERALATEEEERVRAALRRALYEEARVTISYHQAIPAGPGGKYEEFLSKIPVPAPAATE
jgi:phenylacetate-CoA ligase